MLIANDDADTVRRIFELRGNGLSQAEISHRVGINHSTVQLILRNRAYLGLVKAGDDVLSKRGEQTRESARIRLAG